MARPVLKRTAMGPVRPHFAWLRIPRFGGLAAAFGLIAALTFTPRPAEAQVVSLERTGFVVLREQERSEFPYQLNRQDCLLDDPMYDGTDFQRTQIRIRPRVLGDTPSSSELQVWVGGPEDNCTDEDERTGPTADCRLVARESTNQQTPDIFISPRDVIQGEGLGSGTIDTCDIQREMSLNFYVMVIDSGVVQGTHAIWTDTRYDLLPPPPPQSTSTGIAEDQLVVKWKIPIEDERDDTERFFFYCEEAGAAPSLGMGGSTNDGTAGAAGAGNSGTSFNPSCPSPSLIAGTLPDESLRCGSANGAASREGETERILQNSTTYAVGVAAVDQLGNVSDLSSIACGTPEPITSYFEAYRDAGGKGGGGYCGFGLQPLSAGSFGVLLGLGMFVVRRRRRTS